MNMKELKLEGISKDLRYVFTNNGFYDFIDDKTYSYNLNNLISKGVKLVQELSKIEYKLGKISLKEYTSEPRKTLYAFTEIFQPEESIKIIKEWENKFGNKLLLINESHDTLITEQRVIEAWDGVNVIIEQFTDWIKDKLKSGYNKVKQGVKDVANYGYDQVKQIKDKGFFNYAGEKIKKGWNWIKQKAMDAWNCLSNNFVECFMEGLRTAVLSPVGVAIEVFLAVTGVGAPIVMVIYGLLLIWDVYLLFSDYNKFSWFNLLIDVVGIISAGTMVPVVRGALKGFSLLGKGGSKSFGLVAQESISKGGKISKIITMIGDKINKFGSKILDAMKQGAEWVSKNFKINFLKNWINKASSTLDNVKNSISNSLSSNLSLTRGLSPVSPIKTIAAKKAIKAGSADYALGKGIEGYSEYKSHSQGLENQEMSDKLSSSIAGISNISAEDAELGKLF